MSVMLPASGLPRMDDAFGRQPEMMTLFERLFGPYPFARYNVVVTADELEIPLEAQGLSAFGSNLCASTSKSSNSRSIAYGPSASPDAPRPRRSIAWTA
jgi:aminopeptidase